MVQLLNDVIFPEVRVFALLTEGIAGHPRKISPILALKPHRARLALQKRESYMQQHSDDEQSSEQFMQPKPGHRRWRHATRRIERQPGRSQARHQYKDAAPVVEARAHFVTFHITGAPWE